MRVQKWSTFLMYLKHILLEQFRCYERQELSLPERGLRLAGANASGKTSLIEGIQLLSRMKSPRAGVERELINWTSNDEFGLPPYGRVVGQIAGSAGVEKIEVTLSADPQRPSHTRKRILADGQPRRAIDAVGLLKTVLFEPEDMELVLGSPSVRRRYLDVAISTLDATYLRLLSQYNKILEQRNGLLKSIREQPASSRRSRMPELEYWDQELINRAAYIVAARQRFIGRIGGPLRSAFQSLLGNDLALEIRYSPECRFSSELVEHSGQSDLVEGQRIAARWLESEMDERRSEEFSRGVTAIGPHRDDFDLLLGGRKIDAYGSRGQQRLSVVAIKLSEIQAIRDTTGESAVLLLDDVLSELDEGRRALLLRQVAELGGQVIVTATDASLLDNDELRHLPLFHVQSGQISGSRDADG